MTDALRGFLLDNGADLVGFANMEALPEENRLGCPRAVSIAVALNPAIVRRIPTGPHEDYSREYDRRNNQLDSLAIKAEKWLQDRGHTAVANTRARLPYRTGEYQSRMPHKTAARLSGLGWIGKNAALVTASYGSAVRLTCVLTDAPLATGTPTEKGRCGSCQSCQKACPAGAIQGNTYTPGTPREQLLSAPLCDAMLDSRAETVAQSAHPFKCTASCGLCLAACPYTQRYLKKEGYPVEQP